MYMNENGPLNLFNTMNILIILIIILIHRPLASSSASASETINIQANRTCFVQFIEKS